MNEPFLVADADWGAAAPDGTLVQLAQE